LNAIFALLPRLDWNMMSYAMETRIRSNSKGANV
jgi:hypothetical protein